MNEDLELSRNDMVIQVVEEFLEFNERSRYGAGEFEGWIVRLARVGAWVGTVVTCLTEQITSGGRRKKSYADTKGKMLELAV